MRERCGSIRSPWRRPAAHYCLTSGCLRRIVVPNARRAAGSGRHSSGTDYNNPYESLPGRTPLDASPIRNAIGHERHSQRARSTPSHTGRRKRARGATGFVTNRVGDGNGCDDAHDSADGRSNDIAVSSSETIHSRRDRSVSYEMSLERCFSGAPRIPMNPPGPT